MKSVAVLVCTYRGEQHVGRQIDTVVKQTHQNWYIYTSDDGSDDLTLNILEGYREQIGSDRVKIFSGPRKGFAANFFSLIDRADVQADFYAFTDQDDEWEANKLERAVRALSALSVDEPAIYGSRSKLIDNDGRLIGYSRKFCRPSGFANALVQNMVSGNTMVLNAAAMKLIRSVGTNLQVSAHDWWAYLLVTGCGGQMVYDPVPTVRYRQHDGNLYGANVSFRALSRRVSRLVAGDFRKWNDENIGALRGCWELLTQESRAQVELFDAAREGAFLRRLFYLLRSRVYRQTWDGQLGLVFAAITNRL